MRTMQGTPQQSESMEKHNSGKIPEMVSTIYGIIKEDPSLLEEGKLGLFNARVFSRIPQLQDRSKCANCTASMQQYEFTFDYLDARLLERMAEAVKHNITKGMKFTEANRVHITKDTKATVNEGKRQTQCRQLGLIAKYLVKGKQKDYLWVITERGWSALRNEPVPKWVVTFRNRIVDRSEDDITMGEILSSRRRDFDPHQWYEVAALSEGSLF